MATAPQAVYLPSNAQEGLLELYKSYTQSFGSAEDLRQRFQEIDVSYARERDRTIEHRRAQAAVKAGVTSKYQDITIPVIYPQVEEAVTYQAGVFLTGYPIFNVIADPKNIDAAKQMNAIIEENSIRGGWVREFLLAFRDGFKYNVLAMEVSWESTATAALETDISRSATTAVPKEVVWSGNCIKRLDPYNTFWDLRYIPADVSSRGEFAGYHTLMSRTELKSYINSLQYKIIANIKPALESQKVSWGMRADEADSYFIPTVRQDITDPRDDINEPDWDRWVGIAGGDTSIRYKNSYVVTKLYARIIPADFGLKVSAQNTPQIWKLIIVNNSVIICAERLTNAHNLLPIVMGQPLEDGLGYQTKSLAKNVEPFQELATALMKAKIASHRRAIGDRTLYDPSRVSEHHINSDNPSAKIPVRPAAYGKPLQEAVFPFPFTDSTALSLMQDMQQVVQLADLLTGQNRARRGQFQKGNKTLREYEDVMDNSTGRDRMTSILLETQLFSPIKYMIKLNTIQYQGVQKIFSRQFQDVVSIDPIALRNTAMEFKVSDGLLPSDKIISADMLQVGFQTIAASPQLQAGYNLPPMFSYLMKTQNADVSAFEKSPQQMAYEQALGQWQGMAQLALEKGAQFDTPQPVPEQFGYVPGQTEQTQPQQSQPAPNNG